LKELFEVLDITKSSYYYQVNAIRTDKYSEIRIKVKNIYAESGSTYGYRRIHSVLKTSKIRISEKVIRKIMKEDNLTVTITRRRKYSSYKGEISPEVENLIKRKFHAKAPNVKWLTDITEFSLPAGKVYLSPIIDCIDGLPVSWMIGK
jgi:transposase InsO family protein